MTWFVGVPGSLRTMTGAVDRNAPSVLLRQSVRSGLKQLHRLRDGTFLDAADVGHRRVDVRGGERTIRRIHPSPRERGNIRRGLTYLLVHARRAHPERDRRAGCLRAGLTLVELLR